MFTVQEHIDHEVRDIASIFRAKDYKNHFEALDALEALAKQGTLTADKVKIFNANFYGYIKSIEIEFDQKGLFEYVAKGTAYLAGLSDEEKEMIVLYKDDRKYSLQLLDSSGDFPSTFKPETGKCRYPSHWFVMKRVVLANQLGGK